MSIKTLSRLLLIVGLTLIAIAMFMDVTVGYGSDRVINLHKASQQNNVLVLGGFLFLAGIIALVSTKAKSGAANDEEVTLVSKEEMIRLKKIAQENVESGKRSFDCFAHIFLARGDTFKVVVFRFIGGAIAAVTTAVMIDVFISATTHPALRETVRPLVLPFQQFIEIVGMAAVLWYALKRREQFVALKYTFAIELTLYVLWLLVLTIFFEPPADALASLAFFGFLCACGFAAATSAQVKMRRQM